MLTVPDCEVPLLLSCRKNRTRALSEGARAFGTDSRMSAGLAVVLGVAYFSSSSSSTSPFGSPKMALPTRTMFEPHSMATS